MASLNRCVLAVGAASGMVHLPYMWRSVYGKLPTLRRQQLCCHSASVNLLAAAFAVASLRQSGCQLQNRLHS